MLMVVKWFARTTNAGECYLTNEAGGYTAWPSEGGHCEFAPRTQLEIELLQFLKSKFNEDFRVSVERIVSNRGLVNVYEFLSHHPNYSSKLSPEGMERSRASVHVRMPIFRLNPVIPVFLLCSPEARICAHLACAHCLLAGGRSSSKED